MIYNKSMQGTLFVAKCPGQLIIILLQQMRKNRTEFAINMDLVWMCVQETVCYFTYISGTINTINFLASTTFGLLHKNT